MQDFKHNVHRLLKALRLFQRLTPECQEIILSMMTLMNKDKLYPLSMQPSI